MNYLIFISVFFIVFSLMSLYISKRFIKELNYPVGVKIALNIFLVVNLFGVLGFVLAKSVWTVSYDIYYLFSLGIGIIFILFILALVYKFFLYLLNITKDDKRRVFFKKTLDNSSLILAGTLNAKAIYNVRNIDIESVDIKIKNLKKEYKIAQISDIHIGGLIEKNFISKMIKKVNDLNPDIIVITGDLIDTPLHKAQKILNELIHLKSKYGTYYIVGNHEYFYGVQNIIKYISSLGIKVLENESVYIGEENEGFNLLGVYDVFGYKINSYEPDIKQALKNIQKNSPNILLAHQPRYIKEVPNNVDLVLSGHTHGGQIAPFNLLVRLVQPYIRGLNQHSSNTQIYVNKGTGFWGPPMRLGASSEITNITLKISINSNLDEY